MVPSRRKQFALTVFVSLVSVICCVAGWNALAHRAETPAKSRIIQTPNAASSTSGVPAPSPVFATWTVTSAADGPANAANCPGPGCRLRDAIANANDSDVIVFDAALTAAPVTITLSSGELTINKGIQIIGPLNKNLTISGNNVTQIFYVNADPLGNPKDVAFQNLVLTKGNGFSAFSGLIGSKSGGAIGIRFGNLTVNNCTFTNNVGDSGGAIFNLFNTLKVTDCTFTGNKGDDGAGGGAGGAIVNSGSFLIVNNSTFNLNSTPNGGGAIRLSAGQGIIIQSTFTANTAGGGGAIDQTSPGAMLLANCTITGNTAMYFGGGIKTLDPTSFAVSISSCIVAKNNGPATSPDLYSATPGPAAPSFISGGNNLFGTVAGANVATQPSDQMGTQTVPLDPQLASLGNYGGPTQTMPPMSGSPAIDKGSNTQGLNLDQRGSTREVNGQADVGAVEVTKLMALKSLNDLNGGVLNPGETIEYSIIVSNPDPATASSITLTDLIPTGTTFVANSVSVNSVAQPGANPASGISLGSLAQNATATVKFQVTVNAGTFGSILSNTASVGYSQFGSATITSNAATIKVVDCTPITLVTSPSSTNILVGDTATFSASATSTPSPSVKWQVSTNGGVNFTDIMGATSTTLSIPSVALGMNGYLYRAVFSNPCNTSTTNPATLYVSNFANKFADPLVCIAGGDLVTGTASFTNNGPNAVNAAYAVTLNPNIVGIPGTGVAIDPATNQPIGTITVTASAVNWAGALNPGQTVNIAYKATLAAAVQPGQQVCVTVVPSWNGVADPPMQVCLTANCPNGAPVRVSDQKPGSVLIFPYYTSGNGADTRLTLTNTSNLPVTALNPNYTFVHLMFIDGSTCQQADQYVCLTPNASLTIRTSEYDPGATGWVLAVAVDANGIPIKNNVLIGNAFVSDGTYQDTYGAETFAANNLPLAAVAGGSATLFFDGFSYDAAPKAFSIEVQSPVDVTGQKIVTVGLRGSVGSVMAGASQVGTGLVINGKESPAASFGGLLTGSCQATGFISSTSPRVTLGMSKVIPSGQSGTISLTTGPAVGVLMTPKASKFGGIRTLHKTALTTTSITIPVFVPSC